MQNNKGTLNERLVLSGKLEAFEKAQKRCDKDKLKAILESVGIDNPDIESYLKQSNPENKGFIKRIFNWKIF
ncbi:hypothetical protein V8G61_09435 [Gaetbulibacter sp. M240]|uniref:hypothetical protein n=1 Tax=Gaetbulibacter sp. M240 TaxID=3126511 RepID=UPI00374F3F91